MANEIERGCIYFRRRWNENKLKMWKMYLICAWKERNSINFLKCMRINETKPFIFFFFDIIFSFSFVVVVVVFFFSIFFFFFFILFLFTSVLVMCVAKGKITYNSFNLVCTWSPWRQTSHFFSLASLFEFTVCAPTLSDEIQFAIEAIKIKFILTKLFFIFSFGQN